VPPCTNLPPKFKPKTQGIWKLKLAKPIIDLQKGKLTVSVKDRASNIARIERTFAVGAVRDATAPRQHGAGR
jgi:hypothetical protein